MTLAFRSPRDLDDRKFVCDSWARSLRLSESAGFVDMEHWMSTAVGQAIRYIDRPYVTTLLAYEDAAWASDADIYGYIVVDPSELPPSMTPHLYYCYVKDEYRRRGFARALFAAAGVDPASRYRYLCRTRSSEQLAAAKKMPNATFDPVLIRAGRKDRET